MDEDESTERRMQMALLYQRLAKMKQQLNDDDTEYINQAISSKSPDTCWTLLTNLERKGNLQMDPGLLGKLMDIYARVFSSLPLRLHAHDLSYAKMLIRFAELNAIQEVSDAQANFEKARSHCGEFAFVHVSYAQFELSRGNIEKCSLILQNGLEKNAKPRHILDSAVKNLNVGKHQLLLPEDKENREEREGLRSDGAWDHWSSNSSISLRSVLKFSPQDENVTAGRAASHLGRPSVALRVPMVPLSIPQNKSSESEGLHKSEAATPIPVRQAQNSSVPSKIPMGTSRKATPDSDSYCSLSLKNPALSPISSRNTEEVDSITTFLHRPEHLWMDNNSRIEETTDIHQFISTNSLESCMVFLRNLERSGDPSSDPAVLSRLLNFYSRVFTRFPLAKHYKLEGYARMLVRYAELKGIEDPEDAHDEFSIARSYCKAVAFVHVAHAQFELSQGNVRKSRLILHKALDLNAQPVLMLHAALKNLNSGKARLLSEEEEEEISENPEGPTNKKEENPARATEGLPKPPVTEPASERKITALLHKQTSPQDQKPLFDPVYTSTSFHSVKAPRPNPAVSYQSPDHKNPNTFLTPVMKQRPVVVSVPSTAQKMALPQNSKSSSQQPAQTPTPAFSETISIKGRQFFIFKTIGRGGSSKVYQVYDQKKQVYAVKYVNLQEVDAEAVESYKNEIQHLNRLQQYSDQIIKLYDYEITSNYIYMLMECGQLDLNTWLRNRKSVNALDRKCYWRNMLEAVHTIHKHGIIHSDLKPANFVIVDGSLKLIDFGIANRIQPDVTSIMKDSQVGTLNYMPPEAIKDTSSSGKSGSKISPKGDVWSLGCILYCMTYGNTPFQNINNQISKIHSIIDPSHQIPFPDIPEKDLLDVLKRCLVRNPRERISIPELLDHSYLQLQPPPEAADVCDNNLKRILNELAALQSPNSIARATSNLAKMCNSGKRLDVSECVKLLDPPTGK